MPARVIVLRLKFPGYDVRRKISALHSGWKHWTLGIQSEQCLLIICPIAIAYSYGADNKIGLRLSVGVCLSVCHHSHGRISLSIFTKFDTEV